MEFKYSVLLPADDHPTNGLAGQIAIRRHCMPFAEDVGAIRAQRDWKRLVGPIEGFKGGLSRKYGLVQVAVPECRPERLEILAYASELGFLYDDNTEIFSSEKLSETNNDMQSAFAEGLKNGHIESRAGGLKAMQSVLFQEMMAIDEPRAMIAMKVWMEFLQEAAGRQHETLHTSFDSYMQYRILDVGEMFWFGLVTFGMALTIPETDLPLLRKLTRPCWVVLALQNDICSYQKECDAVCRCEAKNLVNVLEVLMRCENASMEAAIDFCRQRIDDLLSEYQSTLVTYRHDKALSEDARIYMESLLYTISGDAVWSLTTPRYNKNEQYSDLQLTMMQEGLESIPSNLPRVVPQSLFVDKQCLITVAQVLPTSDE